MIIAAKSTYYNKEVLLGLKNSLEQELDCLLAYWQTNMVDKRNGGFYGQRLYDESLVTDAPKGVVLNARILWTFAAAFRHTGNDYYLETAHRAYEYITRYFIDEKYGGVYWSVTYDGTPLDTKKQVYAQSFTLYAFAEYYICTKNAQVKEQAIALFNLVEKYSCDNTLGGYIEAFTGEWLPISDLRLSNKDANEKKTMNTHLHILEAYTNLYRINPVQVVKDAIIHLLQVFDRYIIDPKTHHLGLFFDEAWVRKGSQVSYGHDIEAAWLLSEAAEVIGETAWIQKMNDHAVKIAAAAAEGLDKDNALWHEYDTASGHLLKEKHWWPQAEALVGFFHAWQVSGEEQYLQKVVNSWEFIKDYLLDHKNGEWIWGIYEDYSLIRAEDKAGFWKCPYHNGRACMEVVARVYKILQR